ncbi:hypothetical protein JAAARDRAFT_193020 [Jaapia argillacea MUCL 33604]|uniref:Large ribosomal subunit protein mL59 domain-containing protein n=1 Tax=Jaapia argillacea MUCL 33604 TaxID=933084 RepID=A0A067PUR6_9AGAM|nr:hypothetical protein JAAARDRAFT_193020 [Jaapia argillacea MUCL 33604]
MSINPSSSAFQAIKKFRLTSILAANSKVVKQFAAPPKKDEASTKPVVLAVPNPFLPTPLGKKGWKGPKYSLRQQVELVRHARATNTLHLLPPGPKFSAQELGAVIQAAKEIAGEFGKDNWWARPVVWQAPEKKRVDKVEGGASEKQASALAEKQQKKQHPFARVTVKVEKKKVGGLLKLYANRKRMFKGHAWERALPKRKRRQSMLLRDMDKRVLRYKTYHAKRRPNPLAPPRATKAAKLPY